MRPEHALSNGAEYSVPSAQRTRRDWRGPAIRVLGLVFVVAGLLGVYRYVHNFWLYRGYPPPSESPYLMRGATERLLVRSPALGGRRVSVLVYLPPGYDGSPHLRYAVLYLLHGAPGRPESFLRVLRLGVLEDLLIAQGQMRPVLLVMPRASGGLFGGNEWVDGARRSEHWETFVAGDLVHAIDRRYRTIASGSARGVGGLSAGGYGALNIALHHPGEFGLVESWSGYEVTENRPSRLGQRLGNSPLVQLPRVASLLRRAKTYFWFYSGTHDTLRRENAAFATALVRSGIPHRYLVLPGGHDWRLWRAAAGAALVTAARHLVPARSA